MVALSILIVTRGGSLLQHALGVLLLAWRRMLLASATAGVASVLIGETFAVVATKQIPPPLMAHVVVGLFAVGLAYGTAFTIFIEEIIHGIIATIRLIEGEAAAGARAAAIIAEREAGQVGTGLMRLFGARPKTSVGARRPPQAYVAPEVMAVAGAQALGVTQTEADIEATESFLTTTPRPRVNARPVRADQLPRIGWTADERQLAAASEPAAPLLPPIPVRAPAAPSAAPAVAPTGSPGAVTPADLIEPDTAAAIAALAGHVTARGAGELDELPALTLPDAPPLSDEDFAISDTRWSPPSSIRVLPPSASSSDTDSYGAYGEPSSPTRPMSRPTTRPITRPLRAQMPDVPAQRNIWSRISQALVGNSQPMPGEDSASPEADASPS